MQDVVNDLTRVVHGATGMNAGAHQTMSHTERTRPTQKMSGLKSFGTKIRNPKEKKTTVKATGDGYAGGGSPQDVIPLDQSELAEF